MRRVLPVLALLLAGCAFPDWGGEEGPPAVPTPVASVRFPVDLAAHRNATLLLDVGTGGVEVVADAGGPAWVSSSGRYVVHRDASDAWVLLDRVTHEREPLAAPPTEGWVRLLDDATLLVLDPDGRARVVDARTGEEREDRTLPPPPRAPERPRWTQASDDLAVLGAESPTDVCCPPCANGIVVAEGEARHETSGCGLALSPGGRAAWTERGAVHLRERDGALSRLSPEGRSGSAQGDAHLAHVGPVFVGETGVAYVRLAGAVRALTTDSGPLVDVARADVVVHDLPAPQGRVVATLAGEDAVRLWGGTAEGRLLLLSVR